MEVHVPGTSSFAKLNCTQLADMAGQDGEEVHLVPPKVRHHVELASTEGLPVHLVQVRPTLTVGQVLPSVWLGLVHVLRAGVGVDLAGVREQPGDLVDGEGGEAGVPVGDGDQVGSIHVPLQVARGPPVHGSPLDLLDLAGLAVQAAYDQFRPRVSDHLSGHVDNVQGGVLEDEGRVCPDYGGGEGLQLPVLWIEEDGVDAFTFSTSWGVSKDGLIGVTSK